MTPEVLEEKLEPVTPEGDLKNALEVSHERVAKHDRRVTRQRISEAAPLLVAFFGLALVFAIGGLLLMPIEASLLFGVPMYVDENLIAIAGGLASLALAVVIVVLFLMSLGMFVVALAVGLRQLLPASTQTKVVPSTENVHDPRLPYFAELWERITRWNEDVPDLKLELKLFRSDPNSAARWRLREAAERHQRLMQDLDWAQRLLRAYGPIGEYDATSADADRVHARLELSPA